MTSLKDILPDSTASLMLSPSFQARAIPESCDRDIQVMSQHPERALRYVTRAPRLAHQLREWFEKTYGNQSLSPDSASILGGEHGYLLRSLERPQLSTAGLYDVLKAFTRVVADCAHLSLQDQGYAFESTAEGTEMPDETLNIFPLPGDVPIVPLIHVDARFSQAPTAKPGPLDELDNHMSEQPDFQFPSFDIVHKQKCADMESERSRRFIPDLPDHIPSEGLVDGRQCLAALHLSPPYPQSQEWPEGNFDGKEETWDMFSQVWVEMERRDQTVAVIMNHRCAFYLIRHRASRTLYVSSANSFTQPSSYKTISEWSGLLCLAFIDRREREVLGNAGGKQDASDGGYNPTEQNPSGATKSSSSDIQTALWSSTGGLRTVARLGQSKPCLTSNGLEADSGQVHPANVAIYQEVLMIFRTPGLISSSFPIILRAHPTRSGYDGSPGSSPPTVNLSTFSPSVTLSSSEPGPSSFRSEGSGDYCPRQETTLRGYDPSLGVSGLLVLLSRIAEGRSGTVWRGYFDLGEKGAIAIVAKIGAISDLEQERDVYRRLEQRSVRGVPTLLGLYYDSVHGPPSTTGYLVLTDEGDSVPLGTLTDAEK